MTPDLRAYFRYLTDMEIVGCVCICVSVCFLVTMATSPFLLALLAILQDYLFHASSVPSFNILLPHLK